MGAYEFTAFKSGGDDEDDRPALAELVVSAHHDVSAPVETGRIVGESVNLDPRPRRTAPPTTSRRPRWPSAPARSRAATTR